MIGGSLLRDLGVVTVDERVGDWTERDSAPSGERVWECRLDAKRGDPSFLVTVLFNPETGASRTLYAAYAPDLARLPRVSSSIRRRVEHFVQHLRQESGTHS